ncbi:MAG: deoxyribodipyrimidine photo-lyase [Candidatus Methylacidiphilales bacterium]
MDNEIAIFWHRRDLRNLDNAGLYHALKSGLPVLPIFIFDKSILDKLEDKEDKRVTFIYQQIEELKQAYQLQKSDLLVAYGEPLLVLKNITEQYNIKKVFTNHDYEPYANKRDEEVQQFLVSKNIEFLTFKDQCIFEKNEVTKDDGKPYTVFTPYSKKWKSKLNDYYLKAYPTEKYFKNFYPIEQKLPLIKIEEMGFTKNEFPIPSKQTTLDLIKNYAYNRNFLAITGTSRLGVHFRFGTISIREKARICAEISETFLNELIWRDFYMTILYHFPHVVNGAFRPEYDRIKWVNNEVDFKNWCDGITGYPIVDAGMRELNATGFMHNRVRMIVASFLTKHLLIDWRWGEAYFAQKLLDFDLSANNGGWQWAAGSGTDAAPYFRVFNPTLQTEKFDKKGEYIKKWVPEILFSSYVKPIVNHEFARKRCLEVYKEGLKKE